MATFSFAPLSTISGTHEYIKVSMPNSTLVDAPSINKRDGIMSAICAVATPILVGSPYITGEGSTILFIVRHGAYNKDRLEAEIRSINGLDAAIVTINSTLVG